MGNRNEIEEKVIDSYQQDENMMVLIFAQWCVNHDLDPLEVYQRAYPEPIINPLLKKTMEQTVPKEEAGDIPNQTLIHVLNLFGNDALVEIIIEEIEK